MIVGNGQQFTFPIDDPSFTVGGLALRAVAVAAGVVTDRLHTAGFAYSDMASQSLSPAQGQSPQGFPDLCYGFKVFFKLRTVKMDNIADLMGWPQRVYSLSNGLCT